jgi:hypothetical protein
VFSREKRRTERLLNGHSSRPEDESPASTTLPTSQAALVADLLRPKWLPVPARGIATRPRLPTDAAGLAPVGLQPCRLLTPPLLPKPDVNLSARPAPIHTGTVVEDNGGHDTWDSPSRGNDKIDVPVYQIIYRSSANPRHWVHGSLVG